MSAVVRDDPMSPDLLRQRARALLERDGWSDARLRAYRHDRLRALLRHAVAHSPYYRKALGADAEERELADLPSLPKTLLMEQFGRIVTDRRIGRESVEGFLSQAEVGEPYLGEYRVFSTSGSTGEPGIFLFTHAEFAEWVAGGLSRLMRFGVTPETRLVAIGAPSALHITRQLFAGFQAGRDGVPRLSVTTPLAEIVAALNAYRPEALLAYASVAGELAEEQLRGELAIEPRLVVVGSEVLTEETAARIDAAWGVIPVNVYASTEAPLMAVGPGVMQVWQEVILEVVDGEGRPVAPGEPGSKVLLTNLVNRVQPLIRYELSDAAVLASTADPLPLLARVDGRSDDIVTLPARGGGEVRVHPHWLRAPFTRLPDVRQYQIVQDHGGLQVRIVPRASASRELAERVRDALAGQLASAGAVAPPIRVEPVSAIEREPGHAGKLKLVTSVR